MWHPTTRPLPSQLSPAVLLLLAGCVTAPDPVPAAQADEPLEVLARQGAIPPEGLADLAPELRALVTELPSSSSPLPLLAAARAMPAPPVAPTVARTLFLAARSKPKDPGDPVALQLRVVESAAVGLRDLVAPVFGKPLADGQEATLAAQIRAHLLSRALALDVSAAIADAAIAVEVETMIAEGRLAEADALLTAGAVRFPEPGRRRIDAFRAIRRYHAGDVEGGDALRAMHPGDFFGSLRSTLEAERARAGEVRTLLAAPPSLERELALAHLELLSQRPAEARRRLDAAALAHPTDGRPIDELFWTLLVSGGELDPALDLVRKESGRLAHGSEGVELRLLARCQEVVDMPGDKHQLERLFWGEAERFASELEPFDEAEAEALRLRAALFTGIHGADAFGPWRAPLFARIQALVRRAPDCRGCWHTALLTASASSPTEMVHLLNLKASGRAALSPHLREEFLEVYFEVGVRDAANAADARTLALAMAAGSPQQSVVGELFDALVTARKALAGQPGAAAELARLARASLESCSEPWYAMRFAHFAVLGLLLSGENEEAAKLGQQFFPQSKGRWSGPSRLLTLEAMERAGRKKEEVAAERLALAVSVRGSAFTDFLALSDAAIRNRALVAAAATGLTPPAELAGPVLKGPGLDKLQAAGLLFAPDLGTVCFHEHALDARASYAGFRLVSSAWLVPGEVIAGPRSKK